MTVRLERKSNLPVNLFDSWMMCKVMRGSFGVRDRGQPVFAEQTAVLLRSLFHLRYKHGSSLIGEL